MIREAKLSVDTTGTAGSAVGRATTPQAIKEEEE